MNAFITITSAFFDLVLAPFGHGPWAFDLVLWSVLAGLVALVVYKYASNQRGIEKAKDRIKMHLLEIRLFRHDPKQVVASTGRILVQNAIYLGHNLVPMVVLMVPFLTVMVHLVAHYAYSPARVGDVSLLEVRLAPGAAVKPTDIRLDLPDGVVLDDTCGPRDRVGTPPLPPRADCPPPVVRTADGEAWWRLRATADGDHALTLHAGDETITKTWSVGGPPRKVPVMKTRTWEGFLYPGEGVIPDGSAFEHLEIAMPPRPFPVVPDGEMGVLTLFFVISLAAGFALKDVVGVTF